MDVFATYYRTRFWISDFLKSSPVGKHYREIKRITTSDETKSKEYRKRILEKFLEYATTNSPFYRTFKGGNSAISLL